MSNKYLSRDDILNANDIQIEELPVPEWGGTICVKTLTGAERDMLEGQLVEMGKDGRPKEIKMDHLRATVAWLGICDDQGARVFTDKKDIAALEKKSAAALDRVVARIQAMSAMSPADVDSLIGELKNDQRAALPTA